MQNDDRKFDDLLLALSLQKSIGELASEVQSEEVRRGIESAVQKGSYLGRGHPYGYRIVRKADGKGKSKRILEIVPAEAEVVHVIFVMRDNGTLEAEIATWLIEKNIPAPQGGRWTRKTVDVILDDSTYCGIYTMHRKDPERRTRFLDVTPVIVSKTLFYRVRGKRDAA